MRRLPFRWGLLAAVSVAAGACGAYTRHYSFVGGYPANGARAESARARENGGATVSATASTRRVVKAERRRASGSGAETRTKAGTNRVVRAMASQPRK